VKKIDFYCDPGVETGQLFLVFRCFSFGPWSIVRRALDLSPGIAGEPPNLVIVVSFFETAVVRM
jgi:hypothetical protein